MSSGAGSWWDVFWMEGPSLIVLVGVATFLVALPFAKRLRPANAAMFGVLVVFLSLATLMWGRWITGVKGMEPIWWGSAEMGFAMGWLGAVAVRARARRRPSPPDAAPRE